MADKSRNWLAPALGLASVVIVAAAGVVLYQVERQARLRAMVEVDIVCPGVPADDALASVRATIVPLIDGVGTVGFIVARDGRVQVYRLNAPMLSRGEFLRSIEAKVAGARGMGAGFSIDSVRLRARDPALLGTGNVYEPDLRVTIRTEQLTRCGVTAAAVAEHIEQIAPRGGDPEHRAAQLAGATMRVDGRDVPMTQFIEIARERRAVQLVEWY